MVSDRLSGYLGYSKMTTATTAAIFFSVICEFIVDGQAECVDSLI